MHIHTVYKVHWVFNSHAMQLDASLYSVRESRGAKQDNTVWAMVLGWGLIAASSRMTSHARAQSHAVQQEEMQLLFV